MNTEKYMDAKEYSQSRDELINNVTKRQRFIILPVKLITSFLICYYFEYGIFLIIAYILYCLNEQPIQQITHMYESNITMRKSIDSVGETLGVKVFNELGKLKDRLKKVEDGRNES